MYAVLDDDNDAMTATDGTTMTLNVVGITTGSTLMGAHATAVPESIANAINQLSANQLALMTQISQIAAMSLAQGHKHFPSQQRKRLLSNKLQFRPSNPLPAQQQGVSKQDCQSEGGAAEGTGATDVADMAQGVAVGEMNVRHLPTTEAARTWTQSERILPPMTARIHPADTAWG